MSTESSKRWARPSARGLMCDEVVRRSPADALPQGFIRGYRPASHQIPQESGTKHYPADNIDPAITELGLWNPQQQITVNDLDVTAIST